MLQKTFPIKHFPLQRKHKQHVSHLSLQHTEREIPKTPPPVFHTFRVRENIEKPKKEQEQQREKNAWKSKQTYWHVLYVTFFHLQSFTFFFFLKKIRQIFSTYNRAAIFRQLSHWHSRNVTLSITDNSIFHFLCSLFSTTKTSTSNSQFFFFYFTSACKNYVTRQADTKKREISVRLLHRSTFILFYFSAQRSIQIFGGSMRLHWPARQGECKTSIQNGQM
jgi:hypothetical protein